ncbi:MAG: UDP-N-acetylmuramoyl-L-alanyl-D-glutamate--2,6-diaminopimelate ligase [Pyrinomonadaceae bacterium]|nr:UDP-N-acetylmuramoyl-L-alanyl-D-glutamate--2,6-diaminopimelate ligase [Pyrinomonadaceae bacterium]
MPTSNNQHATLKQIAFEINADSSGGGDENAVILDLTHDSRQAKPQTLFVAIRGLMSDGHKFVDDVMQRGAVGVISELDKPQDFNGAWLKVQNARIALAQAANVAQNYPSHKLNLVGITGTNGKTTTAYLINALSNAANRKSAMLTTVEYRIGETGEPAVRTTPEASDTERFLRRAVEENCQTAVMKTSSQALDLHRCDALKFEVAVFSNLTRDHLDYHGTMENYFDSKKRLFDGRLGDKPNTSAINVDDEYGRKLIAELRASNQNVVTYGISERADFNAKNIEVSILSGTKFQLVANGETFEMSSPLVGKPHVYNILAATATARSLGYDFESIRRGIENCVGAPGRFERVPNDKGFAVVVDYAHTDDALLNTLKTARQLTSGKIITVFGCGGDRDKSKRAPMGEIAGKFSDYVILTSDNPRNENPLAIINEIELGLKPTNRDYATISDRREAIFSAISKAQKSDVVLIAGKGHENYQIISDNKFHFDDREIALEAITAVES